MNCDKCSTPVPSTNDAGLLDALLQREPILAFTLPPRHLLPVEQDGETVCPGSPSRAQYLEGQPRDPRYPYRPEAEAPYRQAYAELLIAKDLPLPD